MAAGSGLVKLLAASCLFWCECPEAEGNHTRVDDTQLRVLAHIKVVAIAERACGEVRACCLSRYSFLSSACQATVHSIPTTVPHASQAVFSESSPADFGWQKPVRSIRGRSTQCRQTVTHSDPRSANHATARRRWTC
jgi:hypothetical protein